jgi:hypothetical protein
MLDRFKESVLSAKVGLAALGTWIVSTGVIYGVTPKTYGMGAAAAAAFGVTLVCVAVRGLADTLDK